MSKSMILWATLIVPWLTMLFMKKEDVKYYMPVAFVSMSASAVIHDMGIRLGFWYLKETAFPFSQLTPYLFGFLPVLTMWVFKFTYRHFWAFMITNLILDIGFCFFFLNSFLPSKEILSLGVPPYQVLIITTFHALLLYSYQIWQDDALVSHSEKPNILPNLKPAAAKLLSEDRKGENEK